MIVVVDTNILLRKLVDVDNPAQVRAAFDLMQRADKVIVPIIAFCEAAWAMDRLYKRDRDFISGAIRIITDFEKVVYDTDAVAAGLRMLDDGGGFSDGVLEYMGRRMANGESCVFASFDKKAVNFLSMRGIAATIPVYT
ncbi:MAG: hypothetical protein IKZ87_01230 [Actinomycetaceae bacterium]|nr:hypothetical protein [Actinomycetaceae bacterium]